MTVTKKDIIDRIAESTGLRRTDVRDVVHAMLEQIAANLSSGERIEFRDFGVFEVRVRAARAAQNPKTLEPVHVPQRASVRFKPGRAMRDRIEEAATRAPALVEAKPAANQTAGHKDTK